jgi:hypothetical protein
MELAELKNIKKGQWLFTCAMKPKQFNEWLPEKNPQNYDSFAFVGEEWERFSKYDDFSTIDGSLHSEHNCSIHLVSEKYANFFLSYECDKMYVEPFDETNNHWLIYENRIKRLCEEMNIEYEGF